jgi:hypothetical protein
MSLGGYANAQNPGELPGHVSHAAFQPIATVICNGCRNLFDLPRFVRGKYSDDEMVHGRILFLCMSAGCKACLRGCRASIGKLPDVA